MSVVEFIIALKSQVKLWLVDIVLRLAVPIWGLAGIIVIAVFLGLSTTAMPVSNQHQFCVFELASNIQPSQAAAPIVLAVIACILQLATFTAAFMITKNLQTSRMTKTRVLLGFSPCFL